ncbi:MAG: hypothetical protein IKL09_00145 [Clostridia bacterium]|nr:hypothetical protein [Clostridia bacterium]MBR6645905.1 hypothetical protein [Clostridia bacterium]
MANGNTYTDMTNNEMMTDMINAENQTERRPSPTPDPEDQDTFAEILSANIGAYVLIQFLIGTGSLVDKEGYLYAVGQNFVTIYEPLDDRYVVCDLYTVKFVSIFNSLPQGSSMRTNNSMNNMQNSTNGRYIRNYSQGTRRNY